MKNLTIILLLITSSLFSQVDLNKTGQSTMNFLLVGTSSKAASLGEAYSTLGYGTEAMFYNPAGLAGISNNFEINVNYTKWIADINYLSGGIAWSSGDYGVIGINFLTVDYGTIKGTSLITDSERGAFPLGYKDNGLVDNVGAYAIGISYAKSISQAFAIGGTIKIAGQNLGTNYVITGGMKDNNASKLVFDAGIRYLTGFKSFSFGMYIRNFASNIKRELVDEQLPLIFTVGAAMNIMEVFSSEAAKDNMINVAVDFLHQNNYSERLNLGLEYKFLDMIALRGGYQTNRDLASWSGGIGLNQQVSNYNIEVGYSYSSFKIFNSVSRLSLLISF